MSNGEKILFINIPSYLIIFLPLFLITGPFLSDLSTSVVSLSFIAYCVKYKYYEYFISKYFIVFLFFCLWIVFGSFINGAEFSSIKSTLFYFRFGVFACAFAFLLDKNNKILEGLYYVILLCFVSLILDSFIEYFTGSNILGWSNKNPGINRISSFFGDEYVLGSYLSRLLPLVFALSIFFKKQNSKLFFITLVVMVLAEVIVFLSGERSSFFFINLSAIFIIIFIKDFKLLRLSVLIFSLILIIAISFFNNAAKTRIIDQTIKQFNIQALFENKIRNNQNNKIYIFSKQHEHHYISALRMFKDNQIFGIGVKNFRLKCSEKEYLVSNLSCSTHPHNTYVQFLSETGIVGFGFLIYLNILFLIFILKNKKNQNTKKANFEICLLACILITLWPFIPSGSFFNNWLSIIYYLPIGLLIWSSKKTHLNL